MSQKSPKSTQDGEAAGTDCVHRWAIDPPNGPISMGTCLECGSSKEFHNSFEISYWDNRRKHNPEAKPKK